MKEIGITTLGENLVDDDCDLENVSEVDEMDDSENADTSTQFQANKKMTVMFIIRNI